MKYQNQSDLRDNADLRLHRLYSIHIIYLNTMQNPMTNDNSSTR